MAPNPKYSDRTASPVVLIDPNTGLPLDPGPAGTGDVIDVTLSVDTSAYTAGDVLADTQEVADAVLEDGGSATLASVVVIDEDDQGIAMDLVFFKTSVSLGTENAAPSISDANVRECLGIVSIASGDYIDLGGARVATLRSVGLEVEAGAGATSIYVAAITRGTPTHTASGVRLKLGFVQ